MKTANLFPKILPLVWLVAAILAWIGAGSSARAADVVFVLVHVNQVNAKVITNENEVVYTVSATVLYSSGPSLMKGQVITLHPSRQLEWQVMPLYISWTVLPGVNLLYAIRENMWVEFPAAWKIGISTLPAPIADDDVGPLIVALKALNARQDFLVPIQIARASQIAKATADAKVLLRSPNYFLWSLGAYETVVYGSREGTIDFLMQLLQSQIPTKTLPDVPPANSNIPLLSLRQATWLFNLLTMPGLRPENRLLTDAVIASFTHYLQMYESPDKDSYFPPSTPADRGDFIYRLLYAQPASGSTPQAGQPTK